MLHHTLLADKSFTISRVSVQFLTVVYTPNMTSKMVAPSKTFVTHMTDVGLLTIVYSPNVNEEVTFL